MDKEIILSYVITTRNKLPYLKEVLNRVLENVQPDEEIVITDGASTDGTVDYLTELFNQEKIHQFISEPDYGEAHGLNKGILMARGELIKIISDDDAFYFQGIQDCKKYMLLNKSTNILNTSGGWFDPDKNNLIVKFTDIYENKFNIWLNDNLPFAHCGLGLMLRKSCLPITGLFEVGIIRADAHFSLKFTSLKINFVWFTGCTYVRILNNNSNSFKYETKIKGETQKLNEYYGFDIDKAYESLGSIDKPKKTLNNKIKSVIQFFNFQNASNRSVSILNNNNISIGNTFCQADEWLKRERNISFDPSAMISLARGDNCGSSVFHQRNVCVSINAFICQTPAGVRRNRAG